MELIEEHHRADLLHAHNLEPRHRVLLVGSPGNGKSSLAEVLAYEIGVPLLIVRYEGLITSYLGETGSRLSRLFGDVRMRQCILFFDEFDVIGKERGDVHETGEIKRVVSSLLMHIDELPSHTIVVTATNHPELLDRATWRRFQMRMELPPPSAKSAREYLDMFLRRSGIGLGYSSRSLARRLRGLSFSELEQFCLDAQRRFVLGLPGAEMRGIVQARLRQWKNRYTPEAVEGGGLIAGASTLDPADSCETSEEGEETGRAGESSSAKSAEAKGAH
ncbi:MAG: ATP-binding protein [Bacillota bacterium]|nr:ATP-binding protein [Bacillota bacterium]